jgi:Aspartate oxidase
LTNFLYKIVSNEKNIKILYQHFLIDLIVLDNEIKGAIILDKKNEKIFIIQSKCYILSTGGAGNIFQETTNPLFITGDGIAIAYRKNVTC